MFKRKKMKKILGCLIILWMTNILMAMENDSHRVNLKLVDDDNKIYSIARWKVVQDSSQDATLSIPEITEQQISVFDKALDKINVQVVQKNDDALKLGIKRKIMLYHLPAYKAAFDYLLVSMIADNIASSRVQVEEAYKFVPKSVKKFQTQNLHVPPIEKLGLNSFNGRALIPDNDSCVFTTIPLSTMSCMSLNLSDDTCTVHVYNRKKDDDYTKKDESELGYIGTVNYKAKNINGLGLTTDLRYLVATFDDMLVSKAELYSKEDFDAYTEITNNIKLADIYLLLHLCKVKKEKRYEEFQNEYNYLRDHVGKTEKGKELIKKHFL
jgi:hypothetical protein